MSDYYAVREADCTSEQIEQIFSLAKANMDADSSEYYDYEPKRWEFIIFKESEEIYQCLLGHLNSIRVVITPEEAILRLFEIYLEN